MLTAPLPQIMLAPNGSRLQKADHPAVPLQIDEIIHAAKAGFTAGATALHFHLRDAQGAHILDAAMYREALSALKTACPNMHLQVTSESANRYNPAQMRALIYDLMPKSLSIGLCEMMPGRQITPTDIALYKHLYEADRHVQHILYQPDDIDLLHQLFTAADLPHTEFWCLLVVGHYRGILSDPAQIPLFLARFAHYHMAPDWAVCAFGLEEYACLLTAVQKGGKLRIGFENSIYMPDGTIAADNVDKVIMAKKLLASHKDLTDKG